MRTFGGGISIGTPGIILVLICVGIPIESPNGIAFLTPGGIHIGEIIMRTSVGIPERILL